MSPLGRWLPLLIAVSSADLSRGAGGATDFIPCTAPCDGGDVNYDLVASVRIMPLLNYTYRGRTYSAEGSSDSFMGPTMRVKPGQSLWIKLTNNLTEPFGPIGPSPPTAVDYWTMLQDPGEKIKYRRYKKRVDDPSKLTIDLPNVPADFDATNLHLHGLDVDVHMFDPVGTHNPDAPHISIGPGECYCYRFNVPDHHPPGLYWYHPHVHGSTAIQMWGGMLGLLYVEGPLEEELADLGVTRSEEFVIWDPALKAVHGQPTYNLEVDEFLMGQTTLSKIHPFLVNGRMTPDFNDVEVGQVLHLRVLCATVENENTFIVYPEGRETEHWDDAAVPFWVIGSDGVTYRKPIQKKILVMSGGQREEILLVFEKPGRYVISQQGIQGLQFFDMRGHPHDQILATVTVEESKQGDDKETRLPTTRVPISEMVFTPGYHEHESIQPEEIVGSETLVFSMGANFDQIPFPQYYVNGRPFDPNRLDLFARPGEAREYTLINANHNAHPFHVHVNRFQIQEMGSELSTETYPVLKALLEFDPHAWRDTVMVPPNGRARIWVQYKNYTGKTVFHCHFLAHEDTGMMSTLFIGEQDWVFRWREYRDIVLGCVAGIAGSIVLFLAYLSNTSRKNSGDAYSAVAMNDLKSKTVD